MGKILIIKGADFSEYSVTRIKTTVEKVNLTVVASPTGGGTVTGSGKYNEGSEVVISATASTKYEFVQWNDGNTSATRTITLRDNDITYTATFALVGAPKNIFNKDAEDNVYDAIIQYHNGEVKNYGNDGNLATGYCSVTPGKYLAWTIKYTGSGNNNFCTYDSNKTFLYNLNTLPTENKIKQTSADGWRYLIVPDDVKYVRISLMPYADNIDKFMFLESSDIDSITSLSVDDYIPYQG